jgi:hypothetical protein
MNYFSTKEHAQSIYTLIKDFAINDISQNLSPEDFINNINFIESKIIDFFEHSSNKLSTYLISSDEDFLNITIQVYKSESLWYIEYQDLNKNIHFSVEKFIN